MEEMTKHIICQFETTEKPSSNAHRQGGIFNIHDVPIAVRVAMVHLALFKLDKDWPYVLTKGGKDTITKSEDMDCPPDVCADCGGLVYNNPVLTPNIIKDVALTFECVPSLLIMVDPCNCKQAVDLAKKSEAVVKGLAPVPDLHTISYPVFRDTEDEEFTDAINTMLGINGELTPIDENDPSGYDLRFYNWEDRDYVSTIKYREKRISLIPEAERNAIREKAKCV